MACPELIIVCCHAIWLGEAGSSASEENWLIKPFQREETPTFVQHLQTGLQLFASKLSAVLVVSGAPTHKETPRSEAGSYLLLAQAHNYWNILGEHPSPVVLSRILVEERALDSFYNVVFSLTLFYTNVRAWPERITVVANEFKRARFTQLHGPALRWPRDRFMYVGIDPNFMRPDDIMFDEERAESVRAGERRNGFEAWLNDPRGVLEFLEGKRRERNCWGVDQGLFAGDGDGVVRKESGICWEMVDGREVLGDGRQPWEI
ncbi:hypothetical protein BT63DRAFT_451549 [Microthyrium microscopicum]|uniref:DUF218 domain-containing protein n=1 Tax=Microthyrium microscopicum TaxID=703497 RepID=A0A6A6UPZ1_9PEZI|nr:hypothetical protein BT63DRAFT_451549 [Microthyrium microscopicum]